MRLKQLTIYHENRYSTNPQGSNYEGEVEFFNDKGMALKVKLQEHHLNGIFELCAGALSQAASEACQSIIAETLPALTQPTQSVDKE